MYSFKDRYLLTTYPGMGKLEAKETMVPNSQRCGNTHATKQEINSECVIPECICVYSLNAQSVNSKLRRPPRRGQWRIKRKASFSQVFGEVQSKRAHSQT